MFPVRVVLLSQPEQSKILEVVHPMMSFVRLRLETPPVSVDFIKGRESINSLFRSSKKISSGPQICTQESRTKRFCMALSQFAQRRQKRTFRAEIIERARMEAEMRIISMGIRSLARF